MKIPFLSYLLMKTSEFTRERVLLLFMLLFQISSFSCISGQCLNDQRSLLLQLNSTLIYNSSFSTKLMQWNQNIDCCDWNGVECDHFGHVIGLELDNEMIYGGIEKSSALYSFRYLHNLNLANNHFNFAQIPREVGNLTNLARLNLSDAEFGGQIPVELSQISSLVILDLSDYSFYKERGLWYPNLKNFVQNLTRLEELYLDSVHFTHKGDWWEALSLALPNLRSLSLRYCGLSGRLNSSFLQLHSLSVLSLDENDLSGTVVDFFANFMNLTDLSLTNCSLPGVPSRIFQVPTLQHLDVSNNYLNGSLSSTHFEALSNLQTLDLSQNSLTGNIPTSLFTLPSLQSLFLSQNKFSGQVNEFSTLNSNLESLGLSSNQLEGHIPKSFFRLEKLGTLDLSFNFFNGTIQQEDFQTLQYLADLDLGYNKLSVNTSGVSSEFFSFPQLTNLNLASCNLSRFPNLTNQPDLYSLDLSNNKIRGDIPSWIWEVGNLYYLNLSHNFLKNLQTPYQISPYMYMLVLSSNRLCGELPVSHGLHMWIDYSNNNFQGQIRYDIGRVAMTNFFSVANNNLSGEIPISLCSAANYLQVLDFSGNLLSGGLPPCMVQNLTRLGVLNIEGNNISGNIPDTFPAGCSLSTLDLSSNNLRGNIPPSLANCKSLKVMNVANNNLNGTFPCFLMNISSLHILVLRSNELFGDIRCRGINQSWQNLQIIDIAFNSFTGFLNPRLISSLTGMKVKNSSQPMRNPLGQNFDVGSARNFYYHMDKVNVTLKGLESEIMKILTAMTSIDLSSNKFIGAIPDAFGELSSLRVLNVSHNSFTGTIPRSLGNLTYLESLDLSTNELTGTIPTELTSLTFLAFFNVSYNKLVGMIPSDRQFQTFTAASYEGNIGLCGSPVNQSCDKTIKTSGTSIGEHDVDWLFILAGLGYAIGVALIVVPPLFSRRWGERLDEFQFKLLKLVCSGYRG